MTQPQMKDEQTLANGFELVTFSRSSGVVLAKDDDQYVTWRLTFDGHTVHGNYFNRRAYGGDIDKARTAAWDDYGKRCRENRGDR